MVVEIDCTRPYMRYCAGILLSPDTNRVHLIRKNRPVWQSGLLNAIGGKIEHNEFPSEGMSREFSEEAGVLITPERWTKFGLISYKDANSYVYFFKCIAANEVEFGMVSSQTDEPVSTYLVGDIVGRSDLAGNLKFELMVALMPHSPMVTFEYKKFPY